MTKIKCLICGKEYNLISSHLRVHKISVEEYLKRFPGSEIASDDVKDKLSKTKKQKFALGELKIWNKGLTKELDIRVQRGTEKMKENKERAKKISQSLKGKPKTERHKEKLRKPRPDIAGNKNPSCRPEVKIKRSEAIKGDKNPAKRPDVRKKISMSNKGRQFTDDTKKKMSESKKGKKLSESHKKKISEGNKGRSCPNLKGENNPAKRPEVRKKISENNSMKNPKVREKHQKAVKDLWQNPEYVKKVMEGTARRPTKPEQKLESILNHIFPYEYRYNGNFNCRIVISGKIPDFVNINGKKKLIEFNGCYFHNCPVCYPDGVETYKDANKRDAKRIELFKKYGWDTLVIWEHDMKDIALVTNKILEFHNLPLISCCKQATLENGSIVL